MYLKKLSLVNYKNFDSKEFEFNDKINCFVGNNGVGKTNVLEAIYFLSFTKGYFNNIASQHIKHEAPFFLIDGKYYKNKRDENISCSLKKGAKKVISRNGKEYEKLTEHIGYIPLVIISPIDNNLILEGSSTRRKFMDGVISQQDNVYLQQLIQYQKIVSQRNALLKYFAANRTFDQLNIDIYNTQLTEIGSKIHQKRKEFIKIFTPIFNKRYQHISNANELVDLKYKSQLHEKSLADLLNENIRKDKLLQYTSVGTHKDDLVFEIDDYPIKKYGSQGQQKSFLIALKLAQFDFIKKHTKIKPLLLLDDIFDKLDENRVSQLLQLVNDDDFGQLFITDTNLDRTENVIKKTKQTYKMFEL
ncbi:MAG: DNA replication/repair protein RecF [Flavobacteriaceae bacterium]